jgi:hypothetical protein
MATNSPSQELYNLLITKDFDVKALDAKTGNPPVDEEGRTNLNDADMFSFDYIGQSGKNYGTVVVLLDNTFKVFFGDNVGRTMEGSDKTEWFDFLNQLGQFAKRNLMRFDLSNLNKLKYTMQSMAAIQEGLFESYYGNRKISYAGEPTQARLMIKHNRTLGEGDARFRYIESLFIETADQERYKLPFKNLAGGRAMLEHVRQGGRPYDVRGQHIGQMVEQIAVLSQFRRANQGKIFEGDAQQLVNETQTYYENIRHSLKTISAPRGYQTYFESWKAEELTEQELVVDDIKNLFVEQRIDPRIEAALPMLARIQQQGQTMKEAQIFENWINNLSEGTWALPETPEQQADLKMLMSKPLPVGADATNATEQLYDLVGDDILFDRLNDLADKDPNANCWEDPAVINRLGELGIDINPTVGPDSNEQSVTEGDDHNPVAGAITRRILMQRSDLLQKYGPVAVTQAIDDVADFVGDVEEIGSSDVSRWIKQVEQSLSGLEEGSEDRSRFIHFNTWTVMDGDEEVMRHSVERDPFFSAKKFIRQLDDEGYEFTHVVSPEGRVTYLPQHDPRHLKNFPDDVPEAENMSTLGESKNDELERMKILALAKLT